VGTANRPTPELVSAIRRIIVNPVWTVPRSIATEDLLPKQQQDNSYLKRNNIRAYRVINGETTEVATSSIDWNALNTDNFPYQLKQAPGPSNSLGQIKFDFANADDVFLHDTPGKSLLQLSFRSLSSGCVRLSKATPLAEWLLAGKEKNPLAQALNDNTFKTVSLPVAPETPIQIVYLVAWVSKDDGSVQFRNDIYGKLNTTD
jgi:murein L,D-transpeptidase YcbB/YkuD